MRPRTALLGAIGPHIEAQMTFNGVGSRFDPSLEASLIATVAARAEG